MSRLDPSLAHEFAGALAWWQLAGVDQAYDDDATAWLQQAPAAPAAKTPEARSGGRDQASSAGLSADEPAARAAAALSPTTALPAAPRRDWLGDSPPADLTAFCRWWMDTPDLSPSRGFPRVPPRGQAGAALMVLVPQPEAEDRARLLDGPQGRLLANILAAMGLEEAAVYIASALPAHTPMADLPALAAAGMDAVTAHHIALVRPKRLIAFGSGLGAILGPMPDTRSDQPLREINYVGGNTPVMSSEALDALMDMPWLKARFWRRWMEWSATV